MILIRNPCSPGVHALKTDYTVASLAPLLASSHIDAVVSTLNFPALGEAQIALIDAAKVAGVKRFVPSEFGSDTTNPKVLETVALLTGKKKVVDYLKTKEGDGFEWTSLINGALLDSVGFLLISLRWHLTTNHRAFNTTFLHLILGIVNSISGTVAPFLSASPTSPLSPKRLSISLAAQTDSEPRPTDISLFRPTQVLKKELFDAVRKATPGEEWIVESGLKGDGVQSQG